ncbi:hypothetical protein NL676_027248 [Syzygium grande]|nr:hypothetical protein NL676_027248 [Syzygium grande]
MACGPEVREGERESGVREILDVSATPIAINARQIERHMADDRSAEKRRRDISGWHRPDYGVKALQARTRVAVGRKRASCIWPICVLVRAVLDPKFVFVNLCRSSFLLPFVPPFSSSRTKQS